MSFSFDPSSSLSIFTDESLFFARTDTVYGGLPNGHPSLSRRKKFHPRKLFPPGRERPLQDLPPVVTPQTVMLTLEPAAWKRLLLLAEVPVALFPRSCMSVAKAL